MCFKKWFSKPDPIIIDPVLGIKRTLISFAVNDYPGTANDLRGCINDQNNLVSKVLSICPDFKILKFKDSDATVHNYKTEVAKAISSLSPGAVVIVLADSCYSGTITRFLEIALCKSKHETKNRFFLHPDLPVHSKVKTKLLRKNVNHLPWF